MISGSCGAASRAAKVFFRSSGRALIYKNPTRRIRFNGLLIGTLPLQTCKEPKIGCSRIGLEVSYHSCLC